MRPMRRNVGGAGRVRRRLVDVMRDQISGDQCDLIGVSLAPLSVIMRCTSAVHSTVVFGGEGSMSARLLVVVEDTNVFATRGIVVCLGNGPIAEVDVGRAHAGFAGILSPRCTAGRARQRSSQVGTFFSSS
jgi:hypothetical protein